MRRLLLRGALVTVFAACPQKPTSPVELGVDASRCAESELEAPSLPPPDAALVLINPEHLEVLFDGRPPPLRLPSGVHALRLSGRQLRPTELSIRVDPFRAVALEVRADGELATAVLIGASCQSCPAPQGHVDLKPEGKGSPDALPLARAALAKGNWVAAAEALRQAPPSARRGASFKRLSAATLAFGGRRDEALALAPSISAVLAREEAAEETERGEHALARWNVLSDNAAALARSFSREALGPTSSANTRLDALSEAFSQARLAGDIVEQEAAIDAAEALRQALVRQLRALKPSDCEWQKRVTEAAKVQAEGP